MTDPRTVALALAAAQAGRPLTPGERARTVALAEALMLTAARAAATPPDSCGPEAAGAPRRAVRVFAPQRVVSAATGRTAPDGYQGRHVVVTADVWDRMAAAAAERHRAAGGAAEAFRPPFEAHQVAAARRYAAVAERLEAGGMRCASMEARAGGGGVGRGGASEALLADADWLRRARAAVGPGAALAPTRRWAEAGRRVLTVAVLDQVAIGGLTLSAILRRAGWPPKGSYRRALREALAGALDRIAGLPGRGPQDGG